jgi:hypothetical protein
MPSTKQTLVMDVFPWPRGKGFSGGTEWWDYVMTKDERKRLDNLIGLALLDIDICRRLLDEHDETLYTAFRLSYPTQCWLQTLNASSLTELAEAIMVYAEQIA